MSRQQSAKANGTNESEFFSGRRTTQFDADQLMRLLAWPSLREC
jgi:hypothetical protein